MNITFFIGNGFDLNLGLRTKYEDFYPFFLEHASEGNMIAEWIRNESYEKWSDLERALGQHLEYVERDTLGKYYIDKAELDKLLCDYLVQEEINFDVNSCPDIIIDEFIRSISDFRSGLTEADKKLVQSTLVAYSGETLFYNFLTFNYTKCLDDIAALAKEKNPIKKRKYGGSDIHDNIGEILHIHGTISDGMIMGVNDKNQINNEELRNNREFISVFVKPQINEEYGQLREEQADSMINASRIIAVYGMSMGETDIIRWEKIFQWLKTDKHCLLIIYHHSNLGTANRRYPQEQILLRNQLRTKFFERVQGLNPSEEDIQNIESRILISFQNTLFNFSDAFKDS